MSSINIGSWTLEEFKPREWRAWRRLEDDILDFEDQVHLYDGSWKDITEYAVGDHTSESCDYRRPVPLPSIGGLVEVICKHHRDSDGDYVHPIDPKRRTESRMIVKDWLLELLPGYEEQIANIAEMRRLAERPAGVVEDWTTGKLVSISKSQDKRYTACGVDFVPSGLSKPEELEGYKPSPVPADGWRPIETAPKDGTRVILYEPASVGYGYVEVGEWIMARSRGFWRILSGSLNPTHWQPLPPPPQEKGGGGVSRPTTTSSTSEGSTP